MAVCLPRLSKERLALLIGFFLTIAVAWLIAFSAMDHDWRRVYAGSDTRADELLAGALFAVVYGIPDVAYRIEKYRKLLSIMALVAFSSILSVAFIAPPAESGHFVFTQLFVVVATLVIIVNLISSPTSLLSQLLSLRALVYVGTISYGIYLWHDVLNWIVCQYVATPWIQMAVTIGGGVAFAVVSYRYVERPARTWLTRRLASRAPRVPDAVPTAP